MPEGGPAGRRDEANTRQNQHDQVERHRGETRIKLICQFNALMSALARGGRDGTYYTDRSTRRTQAGSNQQHKRPRPDCRNDSLWRYRGRGCPTGRSVKEIQSVSPIQDTKDESETQKLTHETQKNPLPHIFPFPIPNDPDPLPRRLLLSLPSLPPAHLVFVNHF